MPIRIALATTYARQVVELVPDDPNAKMLLASLRARGVEWAARSLRVDCGHETTGGLVWPDDPASS